MADTLAGLQPDRKNANRGTVRGRALLEDSLRHYGAGRSILADKHGNIIAGNKTAEAVADIGLPVRYVESDGTELIVVKRTDLDLYRDKGARELAYADNRVAELDLSWDIEALLADQADGLDLAAVGFDADELAALLGQVSDDEWAGALGALPDGDKSPFEQMTFTVNTEQAEAIRAALSRAKADGPFVDSGNENSNGNALARVCEAYVG